MTESESGDSYRRNRLAHLNDRNRHLGSIRIWSVTFGVVGVLCCAWAWGQALGAVILAAAGGALAGISLGRTWWRKSTIRAADTPHPASVLAPVESEASEWSRVVAALPEVLMVVTADGVITYANRSIDKVSADQLTGRSVFDLVSHGDRERLRHAITTAIASWRPALCEVNKPAVDGCHTSWWRYKMSPINNNGAAAQCLVQVDNITEDRAAQSAHRRVSEVVESTSDVVAFASADHRILHMNRAGCRLLGWQDNPGQPIRRICDFHPEWAMRRIEQEAMPVVLAKGIWEGETAVRTASGQEVPVSQVLMAHRSESGALEFLSTIMRDIRDRKRSEMEMKQREQRTQRQQAAIFRLLTDRSLTDVNLEEAAAATTEIAGNTLCTRRTSVWLLVEGREHMRCVDCYDYSTARHSSGDELVTADYAQYFAAFNSKRVLDAEDALSDPRTCELAETYLKPQGITSLLDAAISRDGEMLGIVSFEHVGRQRSWQTDEIAFASAVADQVTLMLGAQDRRRVELQLRESEEMFREITESAPAALFETDLSGRVLFANRKALEYFGYVHEDLGRGFTIADVVSFKDRPRSAENFRNLLSSGRTSTSEYLAVRKDGSTFPMRVHAAAVLRDGKVTGARGIIIDTTEQKRYEQEMLKSQKLDSMGVLAGGIAHDFNNMLTGILGNISLVRAEITNPDLSESLVEAERAAIQAQSLTKQLLTFSKGGDLVIKTAAVNEVVRDAVGFALSGSRTRADYDLADSLPAVEIDTGQISQVLHNIAINADQAMLDGGTITVSTETVSVDAENSLPIELGEYICISVRDHGIGMSPQQLPKIFDPYYTTKPDGNGLGLATSYSIVKKHHGHIAVESEPGVGSVFRIYLPVSANGIQKLAPRLPLLTRSQGRVLVLDNETSILRVYHKALSKAGFTVDSATDSPDAIRQFSQAFKAGKPYDAVIVDLTIPGDAGGEETVRRMREVAPEIKAVLCTGYSDTPAVLDYRDHGFQAVVAKPFKPDDLVVTLHRAIHGSDVDTERDAKAVYRPVPGGGC